MSYFERSGSRFTAVSGMKTDYCEISIYMQIITGSILKEANANSHRCYQFTVQHPIDYNEKACIFDSQNKAIKMLVW